MKQLNYHYFKFDTFITSIMSKEWNASIPYWPAFSIVIYNNIINILNNREVIYIQLHYFDDNQEKINEYNY